VVLGTGAGGIDFTLDQYAAFAAGGRASLWTITNATHGNLAGELSINLGLKGPSLCVSTGCASASDAVGLALEMLRSDRPGAPEVMVVVGADAHVRWETLSSMEMLRVISTRDWRGDPTGAATASRPFDRTRDGFVLGEGAWAVVMEREETARRREARVIGEVCGYGVTCDAFHRVRPAPDMEESARAMTLAMEDAGMRAEDVEIVHYHGTSTQVNDAMETAAVKMAFGEHARRLKGHSVKSQIGHPQGACGLAALVATLGALTDQDGGGGAFIPPSINLREPDPECDLDYTPNEAAATGAKVALVNCLAFGAKNSALVVRAG
jgi:3-oxoacyl-[acyl-carrier-protein] synthase II